MNAIITLTIDNFYKKIGQTTIPLMQKYAEKLSCDIHVIGERKINKDTHHFEKFQMYDLLNEYDRILYLDVDILINKNCPNIFEIIK